MKQIKLLATLIIVLAVQHAQAAWGIYKSGLSLNGGYYDCQLNTASPDYNQSYFGRFTSSGSLTLDFAEILTYKNGASNVCGGNLRYRVYRTCDVAPSFSTLALTYCCDFGGTNCTGGACGPDVSNAGDQKWRGVPGSTVNLISGLTASGTYIIEVYYDAQGGDTGGCAQTIYDSNSSLNYIAYFEFDVNDSFTDSNISATPVWSGDTGNFTVIDNSRCSGLLGTENVRTKTVRLNVASGAGTQSLSTQIATWDTQQEWYFWMGRNDLSGGINYSGVNQQAFWLYANESDLESATVDGYRILMGEDVTTNVRLQRMDNGVGTTIFESSAGITNGLVDYGVSYRITRSQTGVWTIYTSTLPTTSGATQSTPTALSCPEVLSTVNHGTTTDNTYVPAANGYLGFQAMHSSGAGARVTAEFDNIRFRALPPSTVFTIINGTSGSVNEDAALAGNIPIEVQLANPSATVGATVDLVLTSGSAGRVGRGLTSNTAYAPSYTTITLTWAANTSGSQIVYIDPDNNDLCDDIANLTFQLQNPTGGNSAFVNTPNTYSLTVVDDNMGYDNLLSANFESGGTTGWTTTGTGWSADPTAPINGTNSLRHSLQAGSGTSSIVYDLDDVCLPGATTTWRFNLKFQDDCSSNNNFQVFLAANETNLFSSTVDGYAVVIDQNALPISGTDEFIRLYRVTDNAYASTPIIGSTYEWLNNLNGGNKVGIEVVLAENGTWTLRVDPDGDFDGLVTAGTGTDATYGEIKNFGIRFKYTAGQSDKLRIDDISIAQKGCRQIWYSRTNGAPSSATLWSKLPSGSVEPAYPGRYSRFVIQNGHTVSNSGTWICQDVTIENGGTVVEGSGNMKVFGQWINDGTFTSGTGTVTFKGNVAQSILGTQTTTYNNLKIDNDGATITCVADVAARGVVTPQEGTLNANGKLTLISNSSGSASIGAINAAASVTNNVILQRYVPSIPWVYGAYVNLGCPIQNQTVADWNDDIITTGFTGSDYPSSSFNNVQLYNESSVGASTVGYQGVSNVTSALETDRGYFVWMQGAQQNLDMTGLIRQGNITQNLSYTITTGGLLHDGWNLMTNPYPSEVDWNLVSSSLTGPKVYYVYDWNTSSYKFRNASNNTGTASRYIPHCQSFLVKVNTAAQSLNYVETHKTATGTVFERSEEDQPFFAIQLSKEGRQDEVIVSLLDAATDGYDDMDVIHLSSPESEAVQMALAGINDLPLSMDSRPYNQALAIPVYAKMPTAGTYTLTIAEDQNLPSGACLVLEDMISGQSINILQGQSMTIAINAPFEGQRFMIRGQVPATIVTTPATCAGVSNGVIDVTTPEGVWNVTLTADQEVYSANGSVSFDHLSSGAYSLTISNGTEACGVNEQTIVVEEPMAVMLQQELAIKATCGGNDGVISYVVNNTDWFAYVLINSSGEIVREGTVEGDRFTEEFLPAGNYEVGIYTTCETFTDLVNLQPEVAFNYSWNASQLNVEVGEQVVLTAQGDSNLNYLWTAQGVQNNGNQIVLSFDEPGVYTVQLNVLNGACSCGEEIEITVGAVGIIEDQAASLVSISQQGSLIWFGGQLAANDLQARVYDAAGRLVRSEKVMPLTGSNTQSIDISTMVKGMYTVVVSDAKHMYATKKIVIAQ
ncbi:MAG: hypothetical protein RLZZ262_1747 [Bacteroidota bacterium]